MMKDSIAQSVRAVARAGQKQNNISLEFAYFLICVFTAAVSLAGFVS
jgi:hypothetical protein